MDKFDLLIQALERERLDYYDPEDQYKFGISVGIEHSINKIKFALSEMKGSNHITCDCPVQGLIVQHEKVCMDYE